MIRNPLNFLVARLRIELRTRGFSVITPKLSDLLINWELIEIVGFTLSIPWQISHASADLGWKFSHGFSHREKRCYDRKAFPTEHEI